MKKQLHLHHFDRFLKKIISPRRLKRIQQIITERRKKNASNITLILAKMVLEQRIRELGLGV